MNCTNLGVLLFAVAAVLAVQAAPGCHGWLVQPCTAKNEQGSRPAFRTSCNAGQASSGTRAQRRGHHGLGPRGSFPRWPADEDQPGLAVWQLVLPL